MRKFRMHDNGIHFPVLEQQTAFSVYAGFQQHAFRLNAVRLAEQLNGRVHAVYAEIHH